MDQIWIFGKKTVEETLNKNPYKIIKIISYKQEVLDEIKFKEKKLLTKKNFLSLVEGQYSHQNIGALIKVDNENTITNVDGDILILDGVSDQRNIGSVIRSMAVFGLKNLIIEKKFIKKYSQIIFKTACGGTEYINLYIVTNINNTLRVLKTKNYFIYAFDERADRNIYEENIFCKKNVFIFGSEDTGIKKLVKKNSDYTLCIPTNTNFKTLNISNAVSAFLLYWSQNIN